MTAMNSRATQMPTNGTDMKVAWQRLGHSSIGITMDLYLLGGQAVPLYRLGIVLGNTFTLVVHYP